MVVATDAVCDKAGCHLVAQSAHDGLARALRPAHTRYDGDLSIALATGHRGGAARPAPRGRRRRGGRSDSLRTPVASALSHEVRAPEVRAGPVSGRGAPCQPTRSSQPGTRRTPRARRSSRWRPSPRAATLCKLAAGRTQVVFGVGRSDADLLFVGEGPGEQEDLKGEPFVGRAGQLLTQLIEGIGLTRDDVYIANVVKCRPPGNRDPQPEEIEACAPWLDRQLELIRPSVIVTLGNFATKLLLDTKDGITKLRGPRVPVLARGRRRRRCCRPSTRRPCCGRVERRWPSPAPTSCA